MKKVIAILTILVLVMSFAQAEKLDFSGTWICSVEDNNEKVIWLLEVGSMDKDGYAKASLASFNFKNGKLKSVNTLNGDFALASDGGLIILSHNDTPIGCIGLSTKEYVLPGYLEFSVYFVGGEESNWGFKRIPTAEEDFANIVGKF